MCRHQARLLRPKTKPTAIAISITPPNSMAEDSTWSRAPIVCAQIVTTMKLTIGVPGHFTQAGIARLRPRALAHSEAAPIGQNSPHQLRPVTTTDSKTIGNHTPHRTVLANRR
jgi:hypothetical protein